MFSSCSIKCSVKMVFWYFITCYKYSIRNFQKQFHQTLIETHKNYIFVCCVSLFLKYMSGHKRNFSSKQRCPGGFCPTLTQIIKRQRQLTIGWLQLGRTYIILVNYTVKQSKKGCKDQESMQSSTIPDPGYQRESNKLTVRHHKREPRGQPFPSR